VLHRAELHAQEPGAWRELWRRLQIHLALGQPF
jgi:hypothetical protein